MSWHNLEKNHNVILYSVWVFFASPVLFFLWWTGIESWIFVDTTIPVLCSVSIFFHAVIWRFWNHIFAKYTKAEQMDYAVRYYHIIT